MSNTKYQKQAISNKKQATSDKGVALYIAFMIMTVLLVIAFGISTILFGELRVIKGMGNSVISFYAADTGIERELFERNATGTSYSDYLDLNGNGVQDNSDAVYNVSVIAADTDGCPANVDHCIQSVGLFKKTRRAIRVTR